MIAILGGGISGLTAAYFLSKKGHKVLILEKEGDVGGLAASFEKEGEFFPLTYHHIMECDLEWQNLCKELGLKIFWRGVKIGFHTNKGIYRIATPFDILKFAPLKFQDRIRLGLLGLRLMLDKNWKKYQKMTAENFIIKMAGKKVYERIFLHLLKSKFGKDYKKITASWLAFRLSKRESKGIFGFVDRGLKEFVSRLEKKIKDNNGEIVKNALINQIKIENNKISEISYTLGNKLVKIQPDLVLNTLPGPVFLELTKGLPTDLGKRIEKIRYRSVVSCIVKLNKKLSDYYWLNILDKQTSFATIFDYGRISGRKDSILYLSSYVDSGDKFWNLDKKEIFNRYIEDLEKIYPQARENVEWFEVFKLRYAKAIYECGYENYCLNIKTSVDNLFFSSMDLFPPMRNIGFAIKNAKEASKIIASFKK